MKKCHFCFEDIQDAAIRCRHCGADIAAAEAAAKEAKFEQSYSNGFGKFWAVVGALIFGALAFGAYTERLYIDIAICVGCALVFLFLAPKAWQVGFLARNAGQPDIIIANSAGELAKQRFYYEYGARIFLTGGLFVALLSGLYFIGSLDRIFESGTPVAASSEVKSSSASVAAEAPAAASSASSVEAKTVADGQSAGSDVAASAAPVQASSDSATQTAQQPMEPEKAVNASLASSAPTANATQQSASTTPPDQNANGTTGIHASFDCGKASSAIERLICSSPETGNADLRLADAYSKARAKSNDPNALKADERNWLVNERNACSDAACLLRVTNDRIAHLSSM